MTRSRIIIGSVVLVVAGACAGAFVVHRREAASRSGPTAAVATGEVAYGLDASSGPITLWCGVPLGWKSDGSDASAGEFRNVAECSRMGHTGVAPTCQFWAECGGAHFEIDCSESADAGPNRCRCDRTNGRSRFVRYDPSFCALDSSNASRSLDAILVKAAAACGWSEQEPPPDASR